jgi:hypothetical protein
MLKWQDAVAILAIPIGILGAVVEDDMAVGICLSISCALIAFSVVTHKELGRFLQIALCLTIAAVGIFIFLYIQSANEKKELKNYVGELIPSDKPTPSINAHCRALIGDRIAILVGTNVFGVDKFPHTILLIGGQTILSVDKKTSETITIETLKLFGRNGNILASIDHNNFWISPLVRKERRDRSSLRIYDFEDREILNISLINKSSLSVSGIFGSPLRGGIALDSTHSPINGACAVTIKADIVL